MPLWSPGKAVIWSGYVPWLHMMVLSLGLGPQTNDSGNIALLYMFFLL